MDCITDILHVVQSVPYTEQDTGHNSLIKGGRLRFENYVIFNEIHEFLPFLVFRYFVKSKLLTVFS